MPVSFNGSMVGLHLINGHRSRASYSPLYTFTCSTGTCASKLFDGIAAKSRSRTP
jgi:hypothetical protein